MSAPPTAAASRPLVVDLDGTFLRTDILWESLLHSARNHPRRIWSSWRSVAKGRAAFKEYLIDPTTLALDRLPVSPEIMEFIRQRKQSGQKIILATGSTLATAQSIERLYPLFDEVLATSEGINLTGRRKAAELEKRFGKYGFDYIGNALTDLHVWSRCHTAFFHNGDWLTRILLRLMHPRSVSIGTNRPTPAGTLVRAIRVHQWVKNLLLLVPFLAAHGAFTLPASAQLLRGLLAFCFTASAAYLLNDLIDIEHDRGHPMKRGRPLAAGHLPIPAACGLTLILLGAAALLIHSAPPRFIGLLAGYFVLTCLYSVWIKKEILADVICLAGLYVWRLLAGGALMGIPLSRWFVVFSVFFFFSLALVKRFSEIIAVRGRGEERAPGRGYTVADLSLVSQMGSASGLLSAVVYCLYIASPEISHLYRQPQWLWLGLPILLYWVCRLWLLAGRGKIHEDPVLFTSKDPTSYGLGALMSVILFIAK